MNKIAKILSVVLSVSLVVGVTVAMLVSAFAGYENTMNAYKMAVKEKYRFFSFGDAMLIL